MRIAIDTHRPRCFRERNRWWMNCILELLLVHLKAPASCGRACMIASGNGCDKGNFSQAFRESSAKKSRCAHAQACIVHAKKSADQSIGAEGQNPRRVLERVST